MAGWADIRAGWDASWQRFEVAALAKWRAAIEATPERFRAPVEAFLSALASTKQRLDDALRLARTPTATGLDRGKYLQLQANYNAVAAGVMAHASPAQGTGAVPVLVVAGLAIGVAGVAWAISAYEYAASLRDQVQLYREDLAARVTAAQQGLILQPSTVPAPPSPPATGSLWPWLLGLGVLGVGGLTVYQFVR